MTEESIKRMIDKCNAAQSSDISGWSHECKAFFDKFVKFVEVESDNGTDLDEAEAEALEGEVE